MRSFFRLLKKDSATALFQQFVDFHVRLTRVFSARLTRHNDGNLLSGFECAPFWVGERCLAKPTRIGSVDCENQQPEVDVSH
jgi:hypothetical protein